VINMTNKRKPKVVVILSAAAAERGGCIGKRLLTYNVIVVISSGDVGGFGER